MPANLDKLNKLEPEHLWALGFFAADGCVSDRGGISISQSGFDGLERLARFASITDATINYERWPKRGRQIFTTTNTDRPFAAWLSTLGITPRKSLTLAYPTQLTRLQDGPFLAGYIDGDGCVGVYKTNTTTTLKISFVGTEAFVVEANRRCPVSGKVTQIKRCRNCWQVVWNGRKAVDLGRFVWDGHTEGFKQEPYQRFLISHVRHWEILEEQKRLCVSYMQSGMPLRVVAALAGLPFQTLYKWRAKATI